MFHREWHEPSKALLLTNEKAARQGRIMFWQSKSDNPRELKTTKHFCSLILELIFTDEPFLKQVIQSSEAN